MEKKVIYIKIKHNTVKYPDDIAKRFEESFKNKSEKTYYFSPENQSDIDDELINDKYYYFFALVYDFDENGKEKCIKAFLGNGKYHNNLLRFKTQYMTYENNAVSNLMKLSNLDFHQDFDDNYVLIEESEYLFTQIDFILSEPYIYIGTDKEYDSFPLENSLHSLAQKSEYCRRQYNLRESQDGRGEFQRDYERIIHSKAFRRMVDKAQVFSASKGDYYRTRMTHSQVVSQIAKGIAVELKLNLDLTEAIALGHDLGHTPFGHQGERTLNDILNDKIHIIKNPELFEDHFGGFKHNYQSVRVASILEEEYFEIGGMDLSYQTLEGMLKHTGLKKGEFELKEFIADEKKAKEGLMYDLQNDNGEDVCSTLEGQVVAVADEIAQRGHDLDDALSSGIISVVDFEKYMEFKKMKPLKEKISPLFKQIKEIKSKGKIISDENELLSSRLVSTIISYFINDVIATSRNAMEDYSEKKFIKNNHMVDKELITLSDQAKPISQYLETIITNRIINSPEIAMFDNNGAAIVSCLFKAYYNDPRLIHKGTQRRIYAETRLFTKNVVDFELGNHDVIRDEIQKITACDLSDENETLSPKLKEEYKQKRRILVRNICDFISGMTDTYAINEYKRIENFS